MLGRRQDISSWLMARAVRCILAVLMTLFLIMLIWKAFLAGASSLLGAYGSGSKQLDPLTAAVVLNPADPEAHYIRANLLSDNGELVEAIGEYQRAALLRRDDYVLWHDLASALDRKGEEEQALTASRQSVNLAPFYARPRWQLGNLLFREGHTEEAFAELRRAAFSKSSFLPSVIDLAWGWTGGDARAVQRLIKPETSAAHVAMAHFFATHEKAPEAVEEFHAAGKISDHYRDTLLEDLLTAKRFKEAYEIWASAHGNGAKGASMISDVNFQDLKSTKDPGFEWEVARDIHNVAVSQDTLGPREGLHSLRVAWNGVPDPAGPVITRLILVEPKSHYRLRFFVRTQELITGGLPTVAVVDAANKSEAGFLSQSRALPQGTAEWRDYTLEFITPSTDAVVIQVQRQSCGTFGCPIFGVTWLADFSLQKL